MNLTARTARSCLVFLLIAAGCARFEPRELSPARSAEFRENLSLTNSELRDFLETNLQRDWTRWPAQPWDFEMLALAAFYYHPDLEVARSQWRVAQAAITTAGARPNPSVSVVPEYNFTPSGGAPPWLPAVLFDLPVETAGKRKYRTTRAQHLSEAARLNVATTAWKVRSTLRLALIDFEMAGKRRELLARQQLIHEERLTLLEQRLRAGAISPLEFTSARVVFAKSALELADAVRFQAESRSRVAAAIGIPSRALDSIALFHMELPDSQATDLLSTEARRRALESRFDILGALAEYAASQVALQLEIAKQYPDIHLGTGYQWDQGGNKWQVGITAELPVLNQNQGPIAEAEARRTEAAAKFEALQAQVLAEVDRSVEVFRATETNLATLRVLGTALKQQNASVQEEVAAGAADRLDLLNSQNEMAATELIDLDARLKREQALASLEAAVQRPLETLNAAFSSARVHAP